MICRTCQRRASALLRTTRISLVPSTPVSQPLPRQFSTAGARYNAAAATSPSSSTTKPDAAPAAATGSPSDVPAGGDAPAPAQPRSACAPGTVLNGLNYFKGRTDPVAQPDEAYPAWLWKCLEVTEKKADDEADADAGDEFSKSKKQRRLAAKRQREREARLLASGDLEALAPKIPLQHQSINLPISAEKADVAEAAAVAAVSAADAVFAAEKRRELRVALRKQRKASIKENNYLRSM